MFGHLNVFIKKFVTERHGPQSWSSIIKGLNHSGNFSEKDQHDDELTQRLINLSVSHLNFKREAFLVLIGEYILHYFTRFGYDELIRLLGGNILEFVQNLDSIQNYLRDDYQDVIAPSFHCDEDSVSDRMILHYFSHRPGYHPLIRGFITEVAKVLYKMELSITIISISNESVADEYGHREHVIFNIVAKRIAEAPDDLTPTFVAQTKKHGERQIHKEDVDAVKEKLDQIRREFGEDALPLAKFRSAKAKWRAIARITLLSRGFVPNYPEQNFINPRMFIEVFPYHLILNEEMKVIQSGIKIQQMMPLIRSSRTADVQLFFNLLYPRHTDFTYENVKKFIMCPFVLEFKRDKLVKDWKKRPLLSLKGQMYLLRDRGYYFFICTPTIRCWYDLEEREMRLADIPMWDATRDFLLTDLAYRIGTGQNYTNSFSFNDNTEALGSLSQRIDDKKTDSNEKWNILMKELNNEKQRNQSLYSSFLPRHSAAILSQGQMPKGDYYPDVTALFCDIVHFLQIVGSSKPIEIVNFINCLYSRFDRVTKIHDTYRVESIGDAYFVVSGVPDKVHNHAERIANTALGMMFTSQEVASPVNGENVQIRIGVHTGSVVGGVFGTKIPRYIVLGETAVVASKMESHGEPGKIHITPSTYRALKGKGYSLEERGKIELRGYGTLGTYYLLGNENASIEDIAGRTKQEVSYINEGKEKGTRPIEDESEVITFNY
ncbi:guanylate cyclase soluble subunit beta-2-like [Mytilus edulis]|uniref:guanylate cyclase soluble subunit beta-2-like n=1 Tax=Mytilus edulis TaxID=6550 RepID=UPI0039EF629C